MLKNCIASVILGFAALLFLALVDPSLAAPTAEAGELSAEVPYPEAPNEWPADPPVGPPEGVSAAMLKDPFADAARWLHYGGDYQNHRHSPSSLDPAAARELSVAWAFGTGTRGQFEVSPVVYGGVMYVTSSYNRVFALDAKSGEMLWRYDHQFPDDLRLCCGPPNRGPAIHGDTLLMGTLDAKLLALDRRTGKKRWEVTLADYQDGTSITAAPLVVGDLAVIGIAGGEFGARGFFDAYRVADGQRVWRHYTVPGKPGDPGSDTWAENSYETGGAPAWTTGAYDAEADVLYWTTGNPSPDWNGDLREGDNLYSNSVLAVSPQTGELKWHFQFTPHDVWDYDGNTQIFLVDADWDGRARKLLVQANRNGFFYVLDRETGEFLRATAYVEQVNWASIGADGRPVVNPKAVPVEKPTERVCPSNLGGMNGAWTGAYNPSLGLAFIPSIEACQRFVKGIVTFIKGVPFMAGLPETLDVNEGKAYGHISAVDVASGEIRWRYRDPLPMMGGVVSTAGGVVISGTLDGHALALNAANGEELWRFRMGGGMRSQPVVYEVDGRTYVAIASGSFAGLDVFGAGLDSVPEGGHLFVFATPEG